MTRLRSGIHLKRVYDPASDEDGARVLVDRLWPRGVSKEEAHLSLWLKDIAPSDELRRWFGHDPARFDTFALRYREELAEKTEELDRLRELLAKGPVTLLYAAHDEVHNNAAVLAEMLGEKDQVG